MGESTGCSLCGVERSVEAAFARDDDPFSHVSKGGVSGGAIGPPGTVAASPLGLLPDHLSSEQHPEVVLEDGGDVCGQVPEGFATEIGHVDGDAPSGLQHPDALGEDVTEHGEVVDVGSGDPVDAELGFVGLASEVGR